MPKPISRWAVDPRFPLTKEISKKCYPSTSAKRHGNRPEIVNEGLCHDMLQRLSPFLLRNKPLDVLDLWPGAGLWSEKLNNFLKPRRHVLVESNPGFKPLLEQLAQKDPSYKLLSMDVHSIRDWKTFLSKYLPEQGPSNSDTSGTLAKNDTLLVLANTSPTIAKRDHYTPARWWSMFMESCLHQAGLHAYGSVRLLMSLPLNESLLALPHTVTARNRPSLMTESVALHTFEVAASHDPINPWRGFRGSEQIKENAALVAQKTKQNNVVIPAGREPPPLLEAPVCPHPGLKPSPHFPRPYGIIHDRLDKRIKTELAKGDSEPTTILKNGKERKKTNEKLQRAYIELNQDNRIAHWRNELSSLQEELDDLNHSLALKAAERRADSTSLTPILKKIEAARSALDKKFADTHYEHMKGVRGQLDDKRASSPLKNPDNAILAWDHRPFEPLLINPRDIYPRELNRTFLYFEADTNPPALRTLSQLSPEEKQSALDAFEAITLTIGSRSHMTVAELLDALFPDRATNDIVRAVPSLSIFATRTPKPDFDSLPKTVHGSGIAGQDHQASAQGSSKKPSPVVSFQENLDYDLKDFRVRTLPIQTLWDLLLEYGKSDRKVSAVQLNRMLGGTLTSFRIGEKTDRVLKLH